MTQHNVDVTFKKKPIPGNQIKEKESSKKLYELYALNQEFILNYHFKKDQHRVIDEHFYNYFEKSLDSPKESTESLFNLLFYQEGMVKFIDIINAHKTYVEKDHKVKLTSLCTRLGRLRIKYFSFSSMVHHAKHMPPVYQYKLDSLVKELWRYTIRYNWDKMPGFPDEPTISSTIARVIRGVSDFEWKLKQLARVFLKGWPVMIPEGDELTIPLSVKRNLLHFFPPAVTDLIERDCFMLFYMLLFPDKLVKSFNKEQKASWNSLSAEMIMLLQFLAIQPYSVFSPANNGYAGPNYQFLYNVSSQYINKTSSELFSSEECSKNTFSRIITASVSMINDLWLFAFQHVHSCIQVPAPPSFLHVSSVTSDFTVPGVNSSPEDTSSVTLPGVTEVSTPLAANASSEDISSVTESLSPPGIESSSTSHNIPSHKASSTSSAVHSSLIPEGDELTIPLSVKASLPHFFAPAVTDFIERDYFMLVFMLLYSHKVVTSFNKEEKASWDSLSAEIIILLEFFVIEPYAVSFPATNEYVGPNYLFLYDHSSPYINNTSSELSSSKEWSINTFSSIITASVAMISDLWLLTLQHIYGYVRVPTLPIASWPEFPNMPHVSSVTLQ